MDTSELWKMIPVTSNYTYWYRKEKFELAEDEYVSWVSLAVEEGSFHYEILSEKGIASFGNLIICPPGTKLRREVIAPVSFHMFWFKWIDPQGAALDPGDPFGEKKIIIADIQRLASNYACMKKLTDRTDPFQIPWISQLFRDTWHLHCLKARQQAHMARKISDPLMERAAAQIELRSAEPFRMRSLSDTFRLTPVQFTRRFKLAHDITPSDYLIHIRVRKALELLVTTDMTLEAIASCCGYENGFYLSRIISKKIKMSPSEYRRTHRV